MRTVADHLLFGLLKEVAPEGVTVGYSSTILYVDKGKRPAAGLAVTFLFEDPASGNELNRDGLKAWRPKPVDDGEGGEEVPEQPEEYLTRPMGVFRVYHYQVEFWTTDYKADRAVVPAVALKMRKGYRTGEDDRLYYIRPTASRDRSDREHGAFRYQWDFEVSGWIVDAEETTVPAVTAFQLGGSESGDPDRPAGGYVEIGDE